jgi:hypothetical protein
MRGSSYSQANEIHQSQSRTGITRSDEHPTPVPLGLSTADQQFSWPFAGPGHRFEGIHDQVEDQLLQLDTISFE